MPGLPVANHAEADERFAVLTLMVCTFGAALLLCVVSIYHQTHRRVAQPDVHRLPARGLDSVAYARTPAARTSNNKAQPLRQSRSLGTARPSILVALP